MAVIENSPLLAAGFTRFIEPTGVDWELFRAWRGALPDDGYDAYILTGDLHNITDGYRDYHLREAALLERLGDRKVFGSCFAHQLIAAERGGGVRRRSGKLLGWEVVETEGVHPAIRGIERFSALCLNTDEVTVQPPSSTLLAASPGCALQMLAYSDNVLTCQAHPEISIADRPVLLRLVGTAAGKGGRSAYRAFMESRTLADDRSAEMMMAGVVKWLIS